MRKGAPHQPSLSLVEVSKNMDVTYHYRYVREHATFCCRAVRQLKFWVSCSLDEREIAAYNITNAASCCFTVSC